MARAQQETVPPVPIVLSRTMEIQRMFAWRRVEQEDQIIAVPAERVVPQVLARDQRFTRAAKVVVAVPVAAVEGEQGVLMGLVQPVPLKMEDLFLGVLAVVEVVVARWGLVIL